MSLIETARAEAEEWQNLPRGLVIAILFAFIHRYTTGKTVEQSFFSDTPTDYQI